MITGILQGPHPTPPGAMHGLHAQSADLVALLIGTFVDRFIRSPGAAPCTQEGPRVRPIGRLLRAFGRCHAAATTQVVWRLMSAALFG